MELKPNRLVSKITSGLLLIVPYGIETMNARSNAKNAETF